MLSNSTIFFFTKGINEDGSISMLTCNGESSGPVCRQDLRGSFIPLAVARLGCSTSMLFFDFPIGDVIPSAAFPLTVFR